MFTTVHFFALNGLIPNCMFTVSVHIFSNVTEILFIKVGEQIIQFN